MTEGLREVAQIFDGGRAFGEDAAVPKRSGRGKGLRPRAHVPGPGKIEKRRI